MKSESRGCGGGGGGRDDGASVVVLVTVWVETMVKIIVMMVMLHKLSLDFTRNSHRKQKHLNTFLGVKLWVKL